MKRDIQYKQNFGQILTMDLLSHSPDDIFQTFLLLIGWQKCINLQDKEQSKGILQKPFLLGHTKSCICLVMLKAYKKIFQKRCSRGGSLRTDIQIFNPL